jgi:hypothetical protein
MVKLLRSFSASKQGHKTSEESGFAVTEFYEDDDFSQRVVDILTRETKMNPIEKYL